MTIRRADLCHSDRVRDWVEGGGKLRERCDRSDSRCSVREARSRCGEKRSVTRTLEQLLRHFGVASLVGADPREAEEGRGAGANEGAFAIPMSTITADGRERRASARSSSPAGLAGTNGSPPPDTCEWSARSGRRRSLRRRRAPRRRAPTCEKLATIEAVLTGHRCSGMNVRWRGQTVTNAVFH